MIPGMRENWYRDCSGSYPCVVVKHLTVATDSKSIQIEVYVFTHTMITDKGHG